MKKKKALKKTYTFTLIAIDSYGSNSDCGILANSLIGTRFNERKINVPVADNLTGFPNNPLNYFLVGDEIFSLKPWLVRPYLGNLSESQKVINYQLS